MCKQWLGIYEIKETAIASNFLHNLKLKSTRTCVFKITLFCTNVFMFHGIQVVYLKRRRFSVVLCFRVGNDEPPKKILQEKPNGRRVRVLMEILLCKFHIQAMPFRKTQTIQIADLTRRPHKLREKLEAFNHHYSRW